MTNDDTTTTNSIPIPALRRPERPTTYKARPIFWHEPGSDSILQSEPAHRLIVADPDTLGGGFSLRGVLIKIAQLCQEKGHKHAVLYLTGGGGGHDAAHTPPADYYRAPLLDSWRITSWRTGPMAVTYKTVGVEVAVRVAASWFDAAASRYTIDQLADAYGYLSDLLKTYCRRGAYLLGTPAQTGLDLLENALPKGLELDVLPDDLRDLIAHNSPQGRNEVFTAPGAQNEGLDTLPGLLCLDAKWMYAACLKDVPAGRYEHLHMNAASDAFEENPHTVGFYAVTVCVPDDWIHVGLLPMWDDAAKKTVYPWRPGSIFQTWCTGAELQVALDYGWTAVPYEAIIWPDAGKHNALRNWRDDLVGARAATEKLQQSLRYETRVRGELCATAIRHILIDAIGALARRAGYERHMTPNDQISTIPDGAYNYNFYDEGIEWSVQSPLSTWAAKFQHLEISATVWGRVRARLARAAMKLAMESIVLARTDALWLALNPDVDYRQETQAYLFMRRLVAQSAHKPGDWRIKESLPGPLPAPRDTPAALELMRQARGRGKGKGE